MSLREPKVNQTIWTRPDTGGALADAIISLSATGEVVDVSTADRFALPGHDTWVGHPLTTLLDAASQAQVRRAMTALANGDGALARAQIVLPDGAGRGLPVLAVLEPMGEGIRLLCLDQTPLQEAVTRTDRLQAALELATGEDRVTRGLQRALMTHIDAALVMVDAATGRILDLSRPAAALLAIGTETAGPLGGNTAFTQCFEGRRRSEFIENLCAAATANRSVRAELRGGRGPVDVRPKMSRASDVTLLVCMLDAVDGSPKTDDLQGFSGLCQGSPDSMVCLSPQGAINEINPAFLRMVAATSPSEVEGRPIVSFLLRGAIDLRAMTEQRNATTFSTQIVGLTGLRTPVEITVSDLPDGGSGLVLRDVTLADATRPADEAPAPDSQNWAQSEAARQVGTVPLRNIVAGMTDVIERDCVEGAIALTQNNRVAAAEMLGLSRQSLYVKLRKFGLLDKGDQDGPA